MKKNQTPALLLAVLYACFFAYLAASVSHLPERVATHFNGSGQPDGWQSRGTNVVVMGVLGTVLPLLVVGSCFAGRYLPTELVNLPRRDYWMAPQRRAETFDYIIRQALWFASLMVCFLIATQYAIVQANSQIPARLSASWAAWEVGCFALGCLGWSGRMAWHFTRDT